MLNNQAKIRFQCILSHLLVVVYIPYSALINSRIQSSLLSYSDQELFVLSKGIVSCFGYHLCFHPYTGGKIGTQRESLPIQM